MTKKSWSTLAFAASALAFAAPAGARTVQSWDIQPSAKTCTMISTFEDDVSIGLIWSPASGELGFVASVPHPNAVGGQAATALELTFDGNGRYTQWEDQRAKVISGTESDAVVATWGAAHSDDLAKAVGAASHVKLSLGGKAIGTYDLSGSPAAYRELTHCGSQIAAR